MFSRITKCLEKSASTIDTIKLHRFSLPAVRIPSQQNIGKHKFD